MWLGEIGFTAVTMPRSFDSGIDACWPVLDRAQLWTSVVNRHEFHALLLLHWRLFSELVETKVKRNISKWYGRRVSFWNDCDELIQEWLNIVEERADSDDLLLCVEGQSES